MKWCQEDTMKLKQFRISLESMVKCRKSPVCTCTVPSHSIDMFYRWQCINHDLYFYQHHSYHLYQSISCPYVIYVMDAMSPPWPLLDFAWLSGGALAWPLITLLAWLEAWTVAAVEAGKLAENGGLTTEIHGKWWWKNQPFPNCMDFFRFMLLVIVIVCNCFLTGFLGDPRGDLAISTVGKWTDKTLLPQMYIHSRSITYTMHNMQCYIL